MFTGIIDHCGTITKIEHNTKSSSIWVKSMFSDLVLGESISINGMCLTVTGMHENEFSCDISPETLAVTTAKDFELSQRVNLERALQLSSRLGGHMVSGHVDQVGKLDSMEKDGDFIAMNFVNIDESNLPFIIKKGSVAVNGVSLTVNTVSQDGFGVMIIPHTLEITNLSLLLVGDAVNIEFDMVARIIATQCENYLYRNSTL